MAVKVIRKFRLLYDVVFGTPADGDVVTYDQGSDKLILVPPSGAPTGAAGGVLGGTYPNPGFAVDMATQAELDANAAASVNDGDTAGGVLSGTYPSPGFAVDMATQAELDAEATARDAAIAAAIASLVDSSPGTLDTLNELAAALGDDPNFATTVTNSISAVSTSLSNHIGDTSDAHDASAVSVADAGGYYSAAEVEAALQEIATKAKVVTITVTDPNGDALTTGDGKVYYRVPSTMNGHNLIGVAAAVSTVSSSGIPTIQLRRVRAGSPADMLSTKVTIDANETDSSTAAAAAAIDASNDDVQTGDQIHVDVDVAGTGTKGLEIEMQFRAP